MYALGVISMGRRCLLLLLLCTATAAAQVSSDGSIRKALDRAELHTITVDNESADLSRYERPVVYARLVAAWAKRGHPSLEMWKQHALAGIAKRPRDRPEENRQRLVTASFLFRIFAPIDERLAAKVLDTMVSGLGEMGDTSDMTLPERDQFRAVGAALADAAARLALNDPERAASLARTIMSLRQGDALASLVATLQKSQPDLARNILSDAIDSTRISLDARFLAGLLRRFTAPENSGYSPSDEMRARLYQVLDATLTRQPASADERADTCQLASAAGQIATRWQKPPLASAVAVVKSCQPEVRAAEAAPPAGNLHTADDYLDAANLAIDTHDRAAYFMQAEQLLAREDPVRAVSIAAAMLPDEREAVRDWRKTFLALAVNACIAFHRADNPRGIDQVLSATPLEFRYVVAVLVADWARRQQGEAAFAAAMLAVSRRALDRDAVRDPQALIMLLNGYASVIPNEAPRVFELVMNMLNAIPHPPTLWRDPGKAHADIVRNGDKPSSTLPPLGYELRPAPLEPAVLDIACCVDTDILRVRDPADLAAIRLGIVLLCLERADTSAETHR